MIPLFSVHVPKNASREVAKVIDSGLVNTGEKVAEFEKMFCDMFGCRYALALNSCTSALRLAYSFVGYGMYEDCVEDRYDVITTPYTMVATNTAILEAGLKPRFADIQYGTANINPNSIRKLVTPKTVAISIVHYAGYPCDWEDIMDIRRKFEIFLIEDCAHSLGAEWYGRSIALTHDQNFKCFSFQAIKHITTCGDGGMLILPNQESYTMRLGLGRGTA